MERQGLVHIYCGDGKGKTTASIGLIIRALGSGMKVVFLQFLKNSPTSELNILSYLDNLTILRGKQGNVFSFSMTDEEKRLSTEIHNNNLKRAIEIAMSLQCDMLVLDEVIGAYNRNLVDKDMLLEFLDRKPSTLEVVLTGRGPDANLTDRADYISEIKKIKHPFDMGISARVGIER
ncbi:cob(I)yrinic acid a,c-diamide adenosyltransferase [Clostridium cylindrosporum]|uniref:Putative cob(I)yrinic acid a c-diamide adenosyltransferase n=1 Tax=Clostridium cylindrosporum DSM 605 TaxID=1121307 RepID=A0A0J8DC62_CLOCY|nr:cob(I)yrinic acid a,c-diamide adenosyltransferase [Clostridium cylindrosporum]KMT21848.1 putative cob(I)yrinic acid a c-diamide adenosyltransferase [Clostridium cylindrosporum DSM 605]